MAKIGKSVETVCDFMARDQLFESCRRELSMVNSAFSQKNPDHYSEKEGIARTFETETFQKS